MGRLARYAIPYTGPGERCLSDLIWHPKNRLCWLPMSASSRISPRIAQATSASPASNCYDDDFEKYEMARWHLERMTKSVLADWKAEDHVNNTGTRKDTGSAHGAGTVEQDQKLDASNSNHNVNPVDSDHAVHEGDVVFVDPLDPNAPYWWIGMIVPKQELDPSMSTLVKDCEVVVRYFDDCHYSTLSISDIKPFTPGSGLYERFIQIPEFVNHKGYKRAIDFLSTGRAPQRFKWKLWNTSGKYRSATGDTPEPSDPSASNSNNNRAISQRRHTGVPLHLQTSLTTLTTKHKRSRQSTPIPSTTNHPKTTTSPLPKHASPTESTSSSDSDISHKTRSSARLETHKPEHQLPPPLPPSRAPSFSNLLSQIFTDMNQVDADGLVKRAPTPLLAPMKRSNQRPAARKQLSQLALASPPSPHPSDIPTPKVMFLDPFRPSPPLAPDIRARLLDTLAERIRQGASCYQKINTLIRNVPRRKGIERNQAVQELNRHVEVTKEMVVRWGQEDRGERDIDEGRLVGGSTMKRSASFVADGGNGSLVSNGKKAKKQ
ncbi:hypothetical protein SeLEV6574_g04857 [Synchytrium endobioticum]|uniref:PWWP domain-containing protein n=1 Tax=Synchytrium endobioticum TaxID=286115 RepID=A0A507CX93_9FUNG|nr:hypothetical protein SeLEV6574_g04847 [Synchytrium endobioticum]TPX43815.1 hypothetical protein SeLEV6574_g04857 [Synchytrium endobioticum]